jgi:hypothetical protein
MAKAYQENLLRDAEGDPTLAGGKQRQRKLSDSIRALLAHQEKSPPPCRSVSDAPTTV